VGGVSVGIATADNAIAGYIFYVDDFHRKFLKVRVGRL
jgi:hypothetical protein